MGGGRRYLDCTGLLLVTQRKVGGPPKGEPWREHLGIGPAKLGRGRGCAFLTPVRRLEPKPGCLRGQLLLRGPRATALASLLGL